MAISDTVLKSVATPSLLIDLDAAKRNIDQAAGFFAKGPVRLRPHFKAHKMTALMRLQIAAGSCSGVTCATAYEAEVLADAGFDDILVANQVADAASLAALGRAASKANMTVAVDCADHIDRLAETAARHNVRFGVLIEIDVGMGRCGLNFGSDDLLPLASRIADLPKLDLLGLQGYEGHVVVREDHALRRSLVWQAHHALQHEKDRLERAGFACPIISGGGTGTFDASSQTGVMTEIQAGSYVLMDGIYADLGLPFENALFCATTVISRRGPDTGVLNAGLKSISGEYGGPRSADGSFLVHGLSDEHCRIRPRPDFAGKVGDPVLLIPAHIDPTINLHDIVLACYADGSVKHWPVDGRRRPRQRIG